MVPLRWHSSCSLSQKRRLRKISPRKRDGHQHVRVFNSRCAVSLPYPVFSPNSDRASREGALRRQYGQTQDAPARAPVKKSSGILKISLERLGTSQDVEIVDDSASA